MSGLFGMGCDNFAFAYSLSLDEENPSLIIKVDDSLVKKLGSEFFKQSISPDNITRLKTDLGYVKVSIPFIKNNIAATVNMLEKFFNESREILPIKKGSGTQLLLLNLRENPNNLFLARSQVECYLHHQIIKFIRRNSQNEFLEKEIIKIVSRISEALDDKKRKINLIKNTLEDFHLCCDNKDILYAENIRHAASNNTGCQIKSQGKLSATEILIAVSVLAKLSDLSSKKIIS